MPVFSLKEAKELQVKNVSENTFKYWGESATYGYFVGSAAVCTIARLDFSNEVCLTPPTANYPELIERAGAFSNSLYGYFAGGRTPIPSAISTVRRLDFSNETISQPGKNLPVSRQTQGLNSNLYGYFAGGSVPGSPITVYSYIDRLDFSNETISSPGKNFASPGLYNFGASRTPSSAYIFGGDRTSSGGDIISTIQRLDFSTENLSNPGKNVPSSQLREQVTNFNDSFAYLFGGSVGAGQVNGITKYEIPTDTISPLGTHPFAALIGVSGVQNFSYGYNAGGNTQPGVTVCNMFRLDFSTESFTAASNNLPQTRTKGFSVSGGQSIYRGSKTYGYFCGGETPSGVSNVNRLDFSNDVIFSPPNNLPATRAASGCVSNNNYGYLVAGFSSGYTTAMIRIDYSNETWGNPGKFVQGERRGFVASISNSNYGYFGGGFFFSAPNTTLRYSTVDRLDFSNETTSLPGKNLSTAMNGVGGASSNSYGYFVGGFPVLTCVITRLDFSNETLSNPGKNLPTASFMASPAAQNNSYAYFGGGEISGYANTVQRIDFSNEIASLPGKNLPTVRSQVASLSSSLYGYFGGGYGPPTVIISTVTRLDFSNENISNPGNNMPNARYNVMGLSNSN